ncbi:hypothetical protein B0I32_10726 [Nonomuraea fuscirosea]|uniref:Uncharacterized protein n=1 Tax=Nonomuraea fuscirosea TaxID=1291556 RepID=A0A2T0N0C3_9ACTN|nr:hypothetical protein [Nonomuraea fuscirosea]PRX65266.1 hypothetical protein B0I32_10726 [Nonomuraea fuscirosea]
MTGYSTIPYTIAFANELVNDPIGFVPYAGRLRLAYLPSRPGDWVSLHAAKVRSKGGILRARIRDLRDHPATRGTERMRKLNTRRQWRCMDKLLCQVCGTPATDSASGLIPWPLTKTVFEPTGLHSGRTNAPPTCWRCIPKALEECPMLREDFTVFTVTAARSVGVLADLYRPGLFDTVMPTAHNVFVAWDDFQHHPYALATAQVVELHGMQAVLNQP